MYIYIYTYIYIWYISGSTHVYIYICIYIYMVGSSTWEDLRNRIERPPAVGTLPTEAMMTEHVSATEVGIPPIQIT